MPSMTFFYINPHRCHETVHNSKQALPTSLPIEGTKWARFCRSFEINEIFGALGKLRYNPLLGKSASLISTSSHDHRLGRA